MATAFAIGAGFSSVKASSLPFGLAASSSAYLSVASVLLMCGLVVVRVGVKGSVWVGWVCAMLVFAALGGAAARLEKEGAAANGVARMAARGELPLDEALRWRGVLRDEPAAVPDGIRYEIALESVEVGASSVPVRGGLRVNYFPKPEAGELAPAVHAGDEVEALVHAHVPRNFMDEGAFDYRAALARQGIDLIGNLRAAELMTRVGAACGRGVAGRAGLWLARVRGALLERVDSLFASASDERAILRAMLLGDKTFVDSGTATDFQKVGAFHVLVVAGLHVGAICALLLWAGRRVRAPFFVTILVTAAALVAYAAIVQDRPPVMRATLTAIIYLAARPFFRRVDLVNTVSLAALLILLFRPSEWRDPSFLLSFLAAGTIAGLAVPLIARFIEPVRTGLEHLGDVTRDLSHSARVAEMRVDLREAAWWVARRVPAFVGRRATEWIGRPLDWGLRVGELLVISIVLQLGMLGMLVEQFHRVSLAAPVSNVPAVVLTGVIVPLGFAALGVSFVWGRAAGWLAWVLGVAVRVLVWCVHWFATVPRLSYREPGPPVWVLVVSVGALVVLAGMSRGAVAHKKMGGRGNRSRWGEIWMALIFVAATVLIATHPFAPRIEKLKFELTVLDVGQGDSLFAAFPDGETMLIDGGGESGSAYIDGKIRGNNVGEEVVAPYLWSRGIKRIDVMVLTHAHHDHLDGLHAILDDFRVKELWVGLDVRERAYRDLIAHAEKVGTQVVHRQDAENFNFGAARDGILWPMDGHTVAAATNNDSLVMRVSDGKFNFMLPGDAEQKVEKNLVESGQILKADFLKVPHHGSKTSSTEEFLEAVAPRVAVASVGAGNSFGHPAAAVVERYKERGIRLLRTDQDGAVRAVTDGKTMEVSTYRERHPLDY
jgi:competence protein ComEC